MVLYYRKGGYVSAESMESDEIQKQSSCYFVTFEHDATDTSEFVIAPSAPQWSYYLEEEWLSFDAPTSNRLEAAWQNRAESCAVKIEDRFWTMKFPHMFAVSSQTSDRIAIHRTPEDNLSLPGGYLWIFWDGTFKQWLPFRTAASEVIENAYLEGAPDVHVLLLCDEWFSVIFRHRLALNKHGQYRYVRRCKATFTWEIFLETTWAPIEGCSWVDQEDYPQSKEFATKSGGTLGLESGTLTDADGNRWAARMLYITASSSEEDKFETVSAPPPRRTRTFRLSEKTPTEIFEETPMEQVRGVAKQRTNHFSGRVSSEFFEETPLDHDRGSPTFRGVLKQRTSHLAGRVSSVVFEEVPLDHDASSPGPASPTSTTSSNLKGILKQRTNHFSDRVASEFYEEVPLNHEPGSPLFRGTAKQRTCHLSGRVSTELIEEVGMEVCVALAGGCCARSGRGRCCRCPVYTAPS